MTKSRACAPGNKGSDGSCFSLDQLIKIASAYNEKWIRESAAGRDPGFTIIKIKKDKRYLLQELHKRLRNKCENDEACWLSLDFVKKLNDVDIEHFTFRPVGTSGQFDWLTNLHINAVMAQYEKIHEDFLFLGAVPIDFDNLAVLGMKTLDVRELVQNNIRRVGVVFNTDEHYKPGQHWVSAFFDIPKKRLYYFDSVGKVPDKRIVTFFARMAKGVMEVTNTHDINKIDISHNHLRHQKEDSECGVYSLNFIIRCLKNEPFEQIVERKMSDREVNKCRQVYFRHPTKNEYNI